MDSATDQFLSDLDTNQTKDFLDQPLETVKKPEISEEENERKAKNRRERRRDKEIQSLREQTIFLNGRLAAVSDAAKASTETPTEEFEKIALGIYGNDTPEKAQASELLVKALRGVHESAKQRALEEFDSRQGNEIETVRQEEERLDEMLDNLEGEYDIDLTGNSADRRGFLDLLGKVSPKDSDGNIIEFADPDTTLELYLSRKQKNSSRAADIASRSMTRSGASSDVKLETSVTERQLKELGII